MTPTTSAARVNRDAAPRGMVTEPEADEVVAVDLGGTHLRVARLSPEGEVRDRRRIDTPMAAPIAQTISALVDQIRPHPDSPSVVAVPGVVDYAASRPLWLPNLPAQWADELGAERLGAALRRPVELANDADLAVVGEATFGAGRGFRDVAFLTVSTGIGAGVVLGGRLVRGRRSVAEIGHTVIDRQAFARRAPSTLEELASGRTVAALSHRCSLAATSAEALAELESTGDAGAVAAWTTLIESVTIGVVNLEYCFGVEVVVMGGGVGCVPAVVHGVQVRLDELGRPAVRLATAAFGDDAGLVGAAAWRRCAGGADPASKAGANPRWAERTGDIGPCASPADHPIVR